MKNIKTYESFIDKFRPNTSEPLPEPAQTDIKGKSIKGKTLNDLINCVIRDFDGEMDLFIDNNYLEFIDINTNTIICSFSGIPQLGETITEDGNTIDDEEQEDYDDNLLYYDVHNNYLEVFNDSTIQFTFDLRNAQDITDIMDDNNDDEQE